MNNNDGRDMILTGLMCGAVAILSFFLRAPISFCVILFCAALAAVIVGWIYDEVFGDKP